MKMKCEKREKKMHYKNENIYENKNISQKQTNMYCFVLISNDIELIEHERVSYVVLYK